MPACEGQSIDRSSSAGDDHHKGSVFPPMKTECCVVAAKTGGVIFDRSLVDARVQTGARRRRKPPHPQGLPATPIGICPHGRSGWHCIRCKGDCSSCAQHTGQKKGYPARHHHVGTRGPLGYNGDASATPTGLARRSVSGGSALARYLLAVACCHTSGGAGVTDWRFRTRDSPDGL